MPGDLVLLTTDADTLHGRCRCGRLTLHVSAHLLRLPIELTCHACGDTLAYIPPENT